MKKVTQYTIVEAGGIEAMVEDAADKLSLGWQPLGGVVPDSHIDTHYHDDTPRHHPRAHTTYIQTWVIWEEE